VQIEELAAEGFKVVEVQAVNGKFRIFTKASKGPGETRGGRKSKPKKSILCSFNSPIHHMTDDQESIDNFSEIFHLKPPLSSGFALCPSDDCSAPIEAVGKHRTNSFVDRSLPRTQGSPV
jgi:hypothetical protein